MSVFRLTVIELNRSRKFLLTVPITVYVLSYLYLAFYHNEAILFLTIIHESGAYTFLETLFYATHFVGHIPVHTVLALYFAGVYVCLDGEKVYGEETKKVITLVIALILLIVVSFLISFMWFGTDDTLSFLLQRKQSATRYEQGGSWNLHLPSTLMQFILIPVYIYLSKIIFQSKIKFNKSGLSLIVLSLFLCCFMTWLVNEEAVQRVVEIWKSPRYLSHSVRELLTFTVTYYPITLFFIFKGNRTRREELPKNRYLNVIVITLSVIFLILFIYQALLPLQIGISDLAQKPSFAVKGELSIAYLLSSHYFEHFLESIFFILLSLILYHSVKKNRCQGL